MRYVANGHVRITGAKMTKEIQAPNPKKAADLGQMWASDNDLVFDGVETEEEHAARVRAPLAPEIEVGIDPARSATVTHLVGGNLVLVLVDPHSVAVVEMSREKADELIAALGAPDGR